MQVKKERKWPRIGLPSGLLPLVMVVLCECLVHYWSNDAFTPGRWAAVFAFAVGFGGILGLICSLIPGKAGRGVSIGLSVLLLILYAAEYLLHDTFHTFMGFGTVQAGAGGVVSTYMSVVASAIVNNWWRILLLMLPIIAFILLTKPMKATWPLRAAFAAGIVLAYVGAFGIVNGIGTDADKMGDAYHFDTAVRCFGLNTAMGLDIFHNANPVDRELEFEIPETQPAVKETQSQNDETKPDEPDAPTEETEPPVVYGQHTLGLDFGLLAQNEPYTNVAAMHSYVASLTPTSENAYTGLFEGKNLIFITAEAFTGAVIDPELTPTLYRLATEGIQFTDYYQPVWGVGTTGGEYSNIVGHVPVDAACMQEAAAQDLLLTIGNQLQARGYRSAAFHNNSYAVYDRHLSHTHLGYDYYMGCGNGLEEGISANWPQSDLEMIDFTVPMYIDQQPFSVYYISVSGHSNYDSNNSMGVKNYDKVAHLDCSEPVKYYLAANLELEYALASLVAQLEEAGIADDTVIVVAADHYPYGLEPSATWGNDKNYLEELFGGKMNEFLRDSNRLIIWSGSIEGMDIVVDEPTYSLDILPTLSNLFGVPYDSRLFIGRDVFSEEEPLVIWAMTGSWKTDRCSYLATTATYTWADGIEPDEEYLKRIHMTVRNKLRFSRGIAYYDYFNYIARALEEK